MDLCKKICSVCCSCFGPITRFVQLQNVCLQHHCCERIHYWQGSMGSECQYTTEDLHISEKGIITNQHAKYFTHSALIALNINII